MKHNPRSTPVDLSAWQPVVSGNARLQLTALPSGHGHALKLDYDFQGGGGFVVARCAVSLRMPEDYAVNFRLRGAGAVNNLELKLVDDIGQNVWRHVLKDLAPPQRWRRCKIPNQEIDFGWGPLGSGQIKTLGSLEIAIVAGAGGKGTLWISDLEIEDCTPTAPPEASASSAQPGFEARAALCASGWKPRPDDTKPWIIIDWTERRAIGGLIIDWLGSAPASGFRLLASGSGKRWSLLHHAPAAGGRRTYVYLPGLRTRFLRLALSEASSGAALRVQSFEFSRSIPAFWNSVAAGEARGWHPRWLHREQSLWTPFGISDGDHCGLINDDGMVEVDEGSFSIEPMLWVRNRLVTWADVRTRQELLQGFLPVPSVIWDDDEWRLTIQAYATAGGATRVRYRLENLSSNELAARLFVLLRPFQVTPPWQAFRRLGGVSLIHELQWRDGAVRVNGTFAVVPESAAGSPAANFGALRFDDGFMPAHLQSGALPAATGVKDPFGFACGALGFDLSLPAHAAVETLLSCAADAANATGDPARGDPQVGAPTAGAPAFDWSARLAVSQWSGNGWAMDAVHAALTATAHVLVTRRGPALQPGPRRYTRSWIRDGAMMSAALLRMGHCAEVREFIKWYTPHQRSDGFVPCCVDAEGTDWLVEHDSHGELLALIADYHHFSQDLGLVRDLWPNIEKAAGFIEGAIETGGLMPMSVSHEGYLAQPVHSFWDDFWTLRGLSDAAELARCTGHDACAQRWQRVHEELAAAVFAAIETTRAQRGLDFIPGSIEWADFDPTATANAIYLLDVPAALNRAALDRTFEKYLADWRSKRSGALAWTNYTPYEIRNIGALVRLGRRDAALELLRFFLGDRRPLAWNQWPEIAWRDHHTPAHLGDLPHTWIAAEYVLAVRALFAYERDSDHALIVAAGLAPEWLEGAGVHVKAMPTLYGSLSYSLRRLDAATLRFELAAGFPGKILLKPPLGAPLKSVIINGDNFSDFDVDSVMLPPTATEVICIT
jgi:hypothetical protein